MSRMGRGYVVNTSDHLRFLFFCELSPDFRYGPWAFWLLSETLCG